MTRVKNAPGQAARLGAPGLQTQQDRRGGGVARKHRRLRGRLRSGYEVAAERCYCGREEVAIGVQAHGGKQGTLCRTAAGRGRDGVWVADLN